MAEVGGAIAEAPSITVTAAEVGATVTPVVESVAQFATPIAETVAEINNAPAPNSEPKIIESLENTVGDLQAKEAKFQTSPDASSGAEANPSVVDNQDAAGIAQEEVKADATKEITAEVKNDPLFQQKLGEALTAAQGKGEPLDADKLSQEALTKYQQEKTEEPTENKTEQQTIDKKLEEAAKRISSLLENNKENLESTMVTVSAADLAILLKALAETKEPNPQKKETKLMLILKLLGILVLGGAMETGKEVIPPTHQS